MLYSYVCCKTYQRHSIISSDAHKEFERVWHTQRENGPSRVSPTCLDKPYATEVQLVPGGSLLVTVPSQQPLIFQGTVHIDIEMVLMTQAVKPRSQGSATYNIPPMHHKVIAEACPELLVQRTGDATQSRAQGPQVQ